MLDYVDIVCLLVENLPDTKTIHSMQSDDDDDTL